MFLEAATAFLSFPFGKKRIIFSSLVKENNLIKIDQMLCLIVNHFKNIFLLRFVNLTSS